MSKTIYETLKHDHDVLKGLLDELVIAGEAKDETRRKLIGKVRDELVPHSRAEEFVFYNALRTIDGTSGMVMHGYSEHMEAESLLRTLQVMQAGHMEWKPVAEKLRDAIHHHIEEEETEIFTAAKAVLTSEEATLMSTAFLEMKSQVKEGSFFQSTMDLITNLMPARFAGAMRTFALGQK